MKPIFIPILLIILFFFPATSHSQNCDFDLIGKIRFAKNLGVERDNFIMTRPKFIKETTPITGVVSHFIKLDGQFFMGLEMERLFSREYDILEDNPLVFQFKNDSVITLFPMRITEGKYMLDYRARFKIKPYYQVSPRQLKLFAKNELKNMRLYFTADSIDGLNVSEDDMGTFFEYEIKGHKKACMKGAKCMLEFL